MIGHSKPKQPEALQQDDNRLDVMPSTPECLDDMEAATKLMADLPQEYDPSLQQPKKRGRSLLRWLIYSLLGFGIFALAAPTFLNGVCGNKAQSSEGRHYVSSMNKAQQAFWLENKAFGRSIPALAIGIKEETDNYKYDLQSFGLVSYHYGVSKNDNVKNFVGAVFVVPEKMQTSQDPNQLIDTTSAKQSNKKELTTVRILCESPKEGVKVKLPKPFLENGVPTCPEGTVSSR